jgi:site-specific DNA-methyltransferase (adenine-specific)
MRHRVDRIVHGDCLTVLRTYADGTFDSLVTDPPAGIGFMQAEWDDYRRARNEADAGRDNVFGRTSRTGPEYGRARDGFVAMLTPIMQECLRVLKPGAHGFVWALPRTSSWTATVIEDVGFKIRDIVTHHFGSGMPKSRTTVLKPASEHWILARKLFDGTVVANMKAHGTGALNVAGCRVVSDEDGVPGRHPSNLILSHSQGCRRVEAAYECEPGCPVAEISKQSGLSTSRRGNPRSLRAGVGWGMTRTGAEYTDSGGASRFFQCFDSDEDLGIDVPFLYMKKASSRERFVCFTCTCGAPPKVIAVAALRADQAHMCSECMEPLKHVRHPTQKPIALMRWLVRLVTPMPHGLVLDPFLGSGTTAVAARLEGLHCVGIEREAAYVEIARARLQNVKGG